MEGHKLGGMGGEAPKPEAAHEHQEGSLKENLAHEVNRVTESEASVDDLDNTAASIFKNIKDPEVRAKMQARLAELRDKKMRLPRAQDIAERMIEKLGENAFDPKDSDEKPN